MQVEVDNGAQDPNSDCLTTDPHSRELEPFAFVHIPKTAGSIVRLMVLSLFDSSRVYPGFNLEHFSGPQFSEVLEEGRYGVFIGHMTWATIEEMTAATESTPNVLTALREPLSHMRSQLAFAHKLVAEGTRSWTSTTHELLDDPVRFWNRDRRGEYGADLAATQILFLLGSPRAADLLEALGGTDPDAAYDQLQLANEVMADRLDEGLATVLFEDLRRSVDLFCAKFKLPHLEISDMRLNASGADHSSDMDSSLDDRMKVWQNLPFEFDASVRKKFDGEYNETFEGVEDIPAYLNSSYRTAVFLCMPYHRMVSLPAENAWPGYGWSPRLENASGQVWRTVGATGRARLFARLHRGNYIVSLKFQSVPSLEAVDGIWISANSTRTIPGNSGHSEGYLLKHFFLQASCFDASDGEVELEFFVDEIGRSDICIVGIDVRPA